MCIRDRFVPGDVYHVDALVWEGEVVFAVSSRYGEPPLSVPQGGGCLLYTSRCV